MEEVKWIKIYLDLFDNKKIKFIRKLPDGNDIILCWVMLLVSAGKCNSEGYIYLTDNVPYTIDMLADEYSLPLNTMKLAMETFIKLHMISFVNGVFYITKWDEYQNIDGLERVKQLTRERVQKCRDKKKQLLLCENNSNVTETLSNVTVTHLDIELELDKDINIYKVLFDFWNSKSIIVHRNLSDKAKRKIKDLLKTYKPEEIQNAISNYEIILHNNKYYWSHTWTLEEFLQRGFDKFISDTCFTNYLQKDKTTPSNQKPINTGNFQQRQYDDKFYDDLYKEV
jgi:predicted phage replisome organizer